MMRLDEPGWTKIGITCTQGRRSLWGRYIEEQNLPCREWTLELCAGREGDDAFVRIDKSNPQYRELADLFDTAVFAAST